MRQSCPEQTFTWKGLQASAFVAFPAQGWQSREYFTHTAAAGVAEIDKTWQINTAYTKQRKRPLNFSLVAARMLSPSLTHSSALAFRLAPTLHLVSARWNAAVMLAEGPEAGMDLSFILTQRQKQNDPSKTKCISWYLGIIEMIEKPLSRNTLTPALLQLFQACFRRAK